MRFSCKYNVLLDYLTEVSGVVDDVFAQEEKKNIIFQLTNDFVKFHGISPSLTIKKTMPKDSYDLEIEETDAVSEDGILFQLKSKELMNFLNSYKSIRKTKVEEVIFEFTKVGKIKCTVVEKENFSEEDIAELMYMEGGDARLNRTMSSHYEFDVINIVPVTLGSIRMSAPDAQFVPIQNEVLQLYTQNMLPIMQNNTTLYGSLMFDADYVVSIQNSYNVVMKNQLSEGGVFKDVNFKYKAVWYLDKLTSRGEMMEVAKTDTHIIVRTVTSEAFILYRSDLAAYKQQLELFKKDHVVTIDRIYLKDVLKRLSLVNDTITVCIKPEEGVVHLSNSKFEQDIAVNYQRGMDEVGNLTFKIMPKVLDEAIIGADDKFVMSDVQYGGDVFMYYCNSNSNKVMVFSDASGGWFSIVRVRVQ